MAIDVNRLHSRGFVDQESYMDIGTENLRGSDGDTARDAAKKFNDHRHSAVNIATVTGMHGFVTETKPVQNPMGLASLASSEDPAPLLRKAGDLVRFNGLLWMFVQENEVVPLGVGPGTYFNIDTQTNTGSLVTEAQRSQELICTRTILDGADAAFIENNNVTVLGELVGGSEVDMRLHSLKRARPLVRFSVTSAITPKDDYYNNFEDGNPSVLLNDSAKLAKLKEFIESKVPMTVVVTVKLDVTGSIDEQDLGAGLINVPTASGTLAPIRITQRSEDGVTTSLSEALYLDVTQSYIFRVYVGLDNYSTTLIESKWSEFASEDPQVANSETLTSYFGSLLSTEGSTVAEQIITVLKLCDIEILNTKVRIDNYYGIYSAVNSENRYTLTAVPSTATY